MPIAKSEGYGAAIFLTVPQEFLHALNDALYDIHCMVVHEKYIEMRYVKSKVERTLLSAYLPASLSIFFQSL